MKHKICIKVKPIKPNNNPIIPLVRDIYYALIESMHLHINQSKTYSHNNQQLKSLLFVYRLE